MITNRGSPLETEADLKKKHLLQAQCYAYALPKGGFGHVNANFVRVEQNDPFNPGQPQIVTYEFGLHQLSSLEKIIYQAYLGEPLISRGWEGIISLHGYLI